MVLTDVLYDLVSGLFGIIMGAVVSFAVNYKRNKQLMQQIGQMRTENQRLLKTIEDKEGKILAQEQEILRMKSAKSKRKK